MNGAIKVIETLLVRHEVTRRHVGINDARDLSIAILSTLQGYGYRVELAGDTADEPTNYDEIHTSLERIESKINRLLLGQASS